MSHSRKQGIIAAVFVGLLGVVAMRGSGGGLADVWRRITGQVASTMPAALDDAEVLRRYGFQLRESARDCGIEFRHEAATLDARLAHIMPLVNPMGAAAAVVDFDGDGWLDIYVVTSDEGGKNALYHNRGDGTFEDVAEAAGVADLNQPGTGACMGSIWADYDNDGDPDLFVYKWGRPELFRNHEGKRFERVTDRAGLPDSINANAACWLDYDRDGRLDLFIAGYWADDVNLWALDSTRIMPESFEYAKNGGRKYLLHNRGDGAFDDVTEIMGIKSTRWTLGVAAADLCQTGYPDLVLANDYGVSEFYANRGGERFEEVGYETGIGVAPKSGMSVSFGDVLNEGKLALYVSNITEPANLVQGNNLWVPAGKTAGGLPRFLNQAGAVHIERGGWSWGAKFGDLNNDGRLDLYLTNGYVSANQAKSYWYDYGKIAGGLKGLINDAEYWPPIGDQSLAGHQAKCVWLNKGGDFIDVAVAVGAADVYDGRAVALGDLFNQGALDVVVANQKGPLLLYRNTVAPGRDWVQFELVGGAKPGRESGWSNRSAVGAELLLSWRQGAEGPPREQVQVVSAGDGYASQSMFRLHFGLGENATIQRAAIKWPSGRTRTLVDLAPGRLHRIEEVDSEGASQEPAP
ncbi:MAG TPA: CRTAC1 family protein [Pirellulales bacterium]|nr:CRTAC1 family protein [Pirellulales bacterium]